MIYNEYNLEAEIMGEFLWGSDWPGRLLLVAGEVYQGLSNVIHVWHFLVQ